MRWFFFLLVVVLILASIFGYKNNPSGCAKLGTDLMADLPIIATDIAAVFTTTTAPPTTPAATDDKPAAPVASATDAAPDNPSAPPPLPANTLILNGNFSQGTAHWEGDGKTLDQSTANPLTAKGLVVTLNPTSWTRIYQTFRAGQGTQYSIVVQYKLSPDISLSKNPADYMGINKLIRISGFEHFGSFNSSPGQFYGTVGDPTSTSVSFEVYAPTLGSSDLQIYQHNYPTIPVSETKTFGLAFPPGTGTVVILGAAVTSN